MTYEALANVIRTQFKTLIADVHSLPTQYDNDPTEPDKTSVWCRLTINFGGTFQKYLGSVGNRTYRTVGIATAQLFCPLGLGDKSLLAMADYIKSAFRGIVLSDVFFGTPSIKRVGRVEGEWQVNVDCPLTADDVG